MSSKTIAQGQQLVFGRSFEARVEHKDYFEVAQFLTHAHGLHWTPEHNAWCRLDDNGDVEDVIKWQEIIGTQGYADAKAIEIDRAVLEEHMSATATVLVQMFESHCAPEHFLQEFSDRRDSVRSNNDELYYRMGIAPGNASYFRGIQIIRPKEGAIEFGARMVREQQVDKVYESFIAFDWKNGNLTTMSCAPQAMASYFEKDSKLPYQTSPVFFNAQVLDKYKADPDKYKLEQRSISCRNSWGLDTYDFNEHGQVHTYITYLGNLPYKEQVYWKSFNERPKGPISKRAYTTDFLADFNQDVDPLESLIEILPELSKSNIGWFTIRDHGLLTQIHYPLTDSSKLWGDTLKTVAKCVVEGLNKTFFERGAMIESCV